MTTTTATTTNKPEKSKDDETAVENGNILTTILLSLALMLPVTAFVVKQGMIMTENILEAHQIELARRNETTTASRDLFKNATWIFHRGTATVEWCENVAASYDYHDRIAEFYNSISNLAFVIVAILGLKRCWESHNNPFHSTYPPLPSAFVVAEWIMLIGVGFGSAMFHAHQSRFAQLADELPMSFLMLAALHCMKGLHPLTTDPKHCSKFYFYNHAVVAVLWAIYLYTGVHDLFNLIFMLQLVVVLLLKVDTARRMKHPYKKIVLMVAWIIGAKQIWNMERNRYVSGACDAPNTIWLHPLWHVGSSISHYYCMSNMADLVKAANSKMKDNGKMATSSSKSAEGREEKTT